MNDVIYRENSTETILVAVRELKEYLQKCKCDFLDAYTIQIGQKDGLPTAADLQRVKNADGFLFKCYGKIFCICGKTDVGTLFGVYRFIEKYLGVEWLTPDCEIMTRGEPFSENTDEVFDFSAYMRWNHCYSGFDQKYRARTRTNYTVGDCNDKAAYGGLRGIKFAFSWGLFGHTFEILLPYEQYYEKHPEWYSFAETHYGENHRYQICLTNPEVFEIVTENALAYLEKHPDCKIISISQNDAYDDFEKNYCVCENCRKIFEADGSYAAVLLQFVNRVARKIKEKFPDVYVHTFAYHFTEEPPKTVVPDENVIVQFCLHLPFGFWLTEDNEVSAKERKKYDGWNKIAKHVFVWTYVCWHPYYFAPIGNFRSLYENTVYFLRSGAFGLFQQENHDYTVGEFSELRGYLTAKMFNNPQMSFEEYCACVQTFLNGYFGEGGKYIYEYLQLLDEKFYHVQYGAMTRSERVTFYADEVFVKKGRALYDAAVRAASNPVYVERLQKNRLQFDFCELCYLYLHKDSTRETQIEYEEKHKAFYEAQRKYGVPLYGENAKLPDLSRIDFAKSPYVLTQKDKIIELTEGVAGETQVADDSTCESDYGFGYSFSLLGQEDTLKIRVDVTDSELWCNSNNMTDWAQDCVEIYISEGFNRTNKKQTGDYAYRVNADGCCYAFGNEKKVLDCRSEKTAKGYSVYLTVRLDEKLSQKDKIGFEIMAHDFNGEGRYVGTRYWNALKFSAVSDRPDFYGIIKIKK